MWFFYSCFFSNICELDRTLKTGSTPLVNRVAQTIDEHIAENVVNPQRQMKPQIALQTPNPMNVTAGDAFTIKLKEANNLHSFKPSEIENPKLVYQVTNGSALGQYEFHAAMAGTTTIRLVVAHETSLAVAFQDVDVIVSEPAVPLEQQYSFKFD